MNAAAARVEWNDDHSLLRLSGNFHLASEAMSLRLPDPAPAALEIRDEGIEGWDSSLLLMLRKLSQDCARKEIPLNLESLPEGARRLLNLAEAVPERGKRSSDTTKEPFLAKIGNRAIRTSKQMGEELAFLGEATLGFGRFLSGRATYRKADFWLIIEQCGPRALGIITTISMLVGAILAFVGAIQLQMFGAEVYVANLVGLGMVMEMGALMTGIILAGRTGASFAAQLGTMQVNEEIDALETLGIPPMDYLVVPRMIALMIMTPLLVVYADVLGIIGGAIVGVLLLEMSPAVYFNQTMEFMTLWYASQGLIKGSTFGALVAIAGCRQGMASGRSASAVGEATTAAVVNSIVLIVIADAIWTMVFMFIQP